MQVLCPHCERLSALERFRLENGVLRVTCVRCSEVTTVVAQGPGVEEQPAGVSRASSDVVAVAAPPTPAPPAPRPTQPPRVSLASSPGASNVVTLRTAAHEAVEHAARSAQGDPFEVPSGFCPKCLATRATAESCTQCGLQFALFQPANVAPPAWLSEAWVALLGDWGNDARHQQVLQQAHHAGDLTALGRLYRLRLATHSNDPIAERGRTEVVQLATRALATPPTAEAPTTNRGRNLGLVVLILVGLGALAFLVRLLLQPAS